MEYKKLSLIVIAALALAAYVLPINELTSKVTAQSNEEGGDESQGETGSTEEDNDETEDVTTEEEEEEIETQGDEDKLKDGDPDANNGNGNDAKDEDEEDDDPDGNPNNREGTPGTERCLERSNGNCANSPVHDGYGDTSEDDADIE